jgi:hypothetical protein
MSVNNHSDLSLNGVVIFGWSMSCWIVRNFVRVRWGFSGEAEAQSSANILKEKG